MMMTVTAKRRKLSNPLALAVMAGQAIEVRHTQDSPALHPRIGAADFARDGSTS
ncbi:hypothetical protein AB4Z54_31960 [Streptomyces sp. MCAF7]